MTAEEIRQIVRETIREIRKSDPAYRWVIAQIQRERDRAEFWRRIRAQIFSGSVLVVLAIAAAAVLLIVLWQLGSPDPAGARLFAPR